MVVPQGDEPMPDQDAQEEREREESEEQEGEEGDDEEGISQALEGPVSTGHPDIFRVKWRIRKFSKLPNKLYSPKFIMAGVRWCVLLFPKGNPQSQYMSTFLDSKHMKEIDRDYSLNAIFELAVLGAEDRVFECKQAQHLFTADDADWGFQNFLRHSVLSEQAAVLLPNDTITIQVTVRLLKEGEDREYRFPQLDLWLRDPKSETGFVGLKNQGATCYMNSLLQALYHIPALRRAVYQMPTEQEARKRQRTESNHPAVINRAEPGANTVDSVALALQRVFYKLQYSRTSVGTKALTKSFGWDAFDAFTQHDVQELDRVLCDNLEEKMKGTPVDGEVPRLLRGKLKNFVKCVHVDFSSVRTEEFYDLSLNVKGCKDLKQSFAKYVECEKLDGENRYMAEGHGLQDAEKGCCFLTFPPVLHLHLKRFEYDPMRDANMKINDRLEFYDRIDLAEYTEDKAGGKPLYYLLHSVLVHSGDVHGGHYFGFIRPDCKSKWFKFNDERVTPSTTEEAIQQNFGCEAEEDNNTAGMQPNVRNRSLNRRFSNAYMLVYVREESVTEVLKTVTDEDIPPHLKTRFDFEEEEEEKKRKQRQEAHLKLNLRVATEKHLQEHHHAELVDWTKALHLTIPKTALLSELKTVLFETTGVPKEKQGIWTCCARTNNTTRPEVPLVANDRVVASDPCGFADMRIYLQELRPTEDDRLKRWDTNEDCLLFFKLFVAADRALHYRGHGLYRRGERLERVVALARKELMPELEGEEVEVYEEVKPDRIELPCMDVSLRQAELQSGDILVLQVRSAETELTCRAYYDFLRHKVTVRFRDKADPSVDKFSLDLHSQSHYDQVLKAVAAELAAREPAKGGRAWNPFRLQLWRPMAHTESPEHKPANRSANVMLDDLIQPAVGDGPFLLFFEEVSFDIKDLETQQLLHVKCPYAGKDKAVTVLVPRQSVAVRDLLVRIRDHCPPPTGAVLFLCHAKHSAIFRVYRGAETVGFQELGRMSEADCLFAMMAHVPPGDALLEGDGWEEEVDADSDSDPLDEDGGLDGAIEEATFPHVASPSSEGGGTEEEGEIGSEDEVRPAQTEQAERVGPYPRPYALPTLWSGTDVRVGMIVVS